MLVWRALIGSTVMTSAAASDGPILILMLNMIENLTSDGMVSWNSGNMMHYMVEVCAPLPLEFPRNCGRKEEKKRQISSSERETQTW